MVFWPLLLAKEKQKVWVLECGIYVPEFLVEPNTQTDSSHWSNGHKLVWREVTITVVCELGSSYVAHTFGILGALETSNLKTFGVYFWTVGSPNMLYIAHSICL